MPSSTILLVVACALIDPSGQVLVQKRPAGKSMAGLWEFPGGKIEIGETPEGALVRELREELGLTVEVTALTPLGFASAPLGEKQLILLLFHCKDWQGEPQSLESEALTWVSPSTLRMMAMPPADLPLIAVLEALLPNPSS
jgi:8-oxo-dGTP diphosphatase